MESKNLFRCLPTPPRRFIGSFFIFAVIQVCILHTAFAQENFPIKTSTSEYMPASPQAASMNAYANVPVSYYTGVPNIDIPIFTIPVRGFSLPISISYHNSGVKVDQVATSVGLGWTLNCGGSITVSSVSKSDELRALWKMPPMPWSKDYNSSAGYNYYQTHVDEGYNFVLGIFDPQASPNFSGQTFDFEPDDYSYNFAQHSGKFIRLNKEENYFQTVPLSTLRIKDNYNVVDEYGVQYFFDEVEVSGNPADPWTPTKSRYLTKVKTLEGDSVTLTYDDEPYTYIASRSETQLYTHMNQAIPSDYLNTINDSYIATDGKRLRSVKSSNGYFVAFEYKTTSRTDLPNTRALEKISVFYIVNSDTTDVTSFTFYTRQSERMFLDSLKQTGYPSYKFYYNGTMLPERLSPAQDFWGYYNSNEASTRVPSIPRIGFFGANRTPDASRMKARSLEKIVYPTGGSVEFVLEPNQFFVVEEEVAGDDETGLLTAQANQSVNYSFTIPEDVFGYAIIEYDIDANGQAGIVRNGGGFSTVLNNTSGDPSGETAMMMPPGNYQLSFNNSTATTVSSANIKWITLDTVQVNDSRNGGGLRIREIHRFDERSQLVGKQLFEYTIPGTTRTSAVIQKIPNAILHYRDDKLWRPRDPFGLAADAFYAEEWAYVSISSADVSNEARATGNNIAYEYVTEYNYDDNAGKTIYRFSTPSYFLPGAEFTDSYLDPIVKGKLIEKKQFRKNDNGQFQIVSKDLNSYYFSTPFDSAYRTGYKFKLVKGEVDEVIGHVHHFYPADVLIHSYEQNNYWVAPKDQVSRIYDVNDTTKFTETRVRTLYSTPGSLSIGQKMIIDPDTLYTSFTYMNIPDFWLLNRPTEIIKRWIKSEPTASNIFSASKLTYLYDSAKITVLPKELFTASISTPVNSIALQSLYETDVIFENYDSNCNPLTMRDKTDIQTCFIWGPNNQPLAKVANTDHTQVAFSSFENGGHEGGWSFASGSTPGGKTGKKGHSLNNKPVTRTGLTSGEKYIVSFWAHSGSVSVSGVVENHDAPVAGPDGWRHYKKVISGVTSVTISGTAVIDELRLHPVDAVMTTNTFEGHLLNTSTDINSIPQSFEYDNLQRLKVVRDQHGNIITKYDYHFKRQ